MNIERQRLLKLASYRKREDSFEQFVERLDKVMLSRYDDPDKEEVRSRMIKEYWLSKQFVGRDKRNQEKYIKSVLSNVYFRGKYSNWLCTKCGKCSHWQNCCGGTSEVINIGYKARAPKISANKKKWKKFCILFKIDYNKLEFLK